MNDEIILKYLADALSEKEKAEFEAGLDSDPIAKERFEEIRRKFATIRELADVEPNNAYFNSIDADSVIKAKKKSFAKKGFSFATSFAVLLILFFIAKGAFKTEQEQFMFSEDELQIVNQLTEYDLSVGITIFDLPKYDIEKIAEDLDETILLDNIDDSLVEFYQIYSQSEQYLTLASEINEEDFSAAIKELSNVKF
jgi:hypothetical protein